jgi:hypothetical protein
MKIYVQKQIQALYTPNEKKKSMKFNIIKKYNNNTINHIKGQTIDDKGQVLKINLKKYRISDFKQHIKNNDSYRLTSNDVYKIYDESKIKSIKVIKPLDTMKSTKSVKPLHKKKSTKLVKSLDKKKSTKLVKPLHKKKSTKSVKPLHTMKSTKKSVKPLHTMKSTKKSVKPLHKKKKISKPKKTLDKKKLTKK